MNIQFVTVEVDVGVGGTSLRSTVEARLSAQGEPLRWAITAVKSGKASVEAVVLQEAGRQ